MGELRPHIPLWAFIVMVTLAVGMVEPAIGPWAFPAWGLILFGYKIRPLYEQWLEGRRKLYAAGQLQRTPRYYAALIASGLAVAALFWFLSAGSASAQTVTPTPDLYGPVTYQQAADTLWVLTRLMLLIEAAFGLLIAYAFWRFVWLVVIEPVFRLVRGRQV